MKPYLLALALGNFAIGAGSLVIAGILRPLASGLHVAVGDVGQLITVYALAYAVASPLLIAATSALPRRTLLLAGIVVLALGNVLGAAAPSFGVLAISRVLAALGAAAFTPVAASVAAALAAPERRGRDIGVVFGGLTVATALGVPLGTFVGLRAGWRAALVMVVVLALLAVMAVARTVPATVATPRVSLRAWRQLFAAPSLLLAVSITLVQTTAQFVVFTYIGPLLQRGIGADGTAVTLLLLAFGLASVVGNVAAGYGADRWGARQSVALALALLVVALFGMRFIHGAPAFAVAALAVWGMAGFGFHPPQQARLVALAPSLQGAILALNASALYLGTAAGAFVGGAIVRGGAYDALAPVGSVLAVVALAGLALSWSTSAMPAAPPSALPTTAGVQRS